MDTEAEELEAVERFTVQTSKQNKVRNTRMNEKTLDNTSVADAKTKVSDIKVTGNGDLFRLVAKASSESEGWMKSTKVCELPMGCIVQVTTQQKGLDGTYAVAEALTFVPGATFEMLQNV